LPGAAAVAAALGGTFVAPIGCAFVLLVALVAGAPIAAAAGRPILAVRGALVFLVSLVWGPLLLGVRGAGTVPCPLVLGVAGGLVLAVARALVATLAATIAVRVRRTLLLLLDHALQGRLRVDGELRPV